MKDYCTLFLEGNWSHCCEAHDKAYERQYPFITSNKRLYQCVKRRGHPVVAALMFIGTTLCGWPFYLKARWRRHAHK